MAYKPDESLWEKIKGGLNGISSQLLEQHFGLYKGYVNNLNTLRAEMEQARKDGNTNALAVSDRRRRFGFEYNGVRLHELYFENLKNNGGEPSQKVKDLIAKNFGSFDAWKKEFTDTGATRSIGWAILYLDPATNILNNHFIELHEDGNVSGFQPILVMDVWEHAYIIDQGALGRPKYIAAFMNNIDWDVVEKRIDDALAGKIIKRQL
eukprot:GEZU01036836.1.p1 GENE.GEZU01036836.1~~GEZU01036836.1.p1  ORF type:complete len:208 (+),score=97.37 GEZU01036836.1:183-806(+)